MMGRRLLELGFVGALAIAQPVFDLLGRNPEFLVAHRLENGGLVLFAIAAATLPALALWAIELAVHRAAPRASERLHGALLALLFTAMVLAPLQRAIHGPPIVAIGPAAAIGVALALLVARSNDAKRILGFGSVALPVLVALFLLRPEVRGLVLADSDGTSPGGATESDTPVLVVILDALPLASILDADGRIDARGFPHLSALAREAVWFRNASTNADFTARAVPAILSGRIPVESRNAHWSEYPDNLFTMLGGSHEIVAAEAVTSLCPPRLDRGAGSGLRELLGDVSLVYAHAVLPPALRRRLPPVDEGWRAFGHGSEGILGEGTLGRRIAHIDRFVARLGELEGTRPPLAFLHAEIPHRPYGVYPSGRFYSSTGHEPGGRTERGKRVGDPQVAAHARQRHLLQAGYADRRLGEILDEWRRIGAYDRSVIVVVSDHGVSFRPGRSARHLTQANHTAILPVPLLVKLPGGERGGAIRDENVELVDVLPMIAAAAGLSPGFEVDGRNALAPGFQPRPTKRVVVRASGRVVEFAPDLFDHALANARGWLEGIAGSALRAEATSVVDQPVPESRLAPPSERPFGIDSPRQVKIGAEDLLLPGEAFGFVESGLDSYADQVVVVAVDGIAVAITRPYPPWPGQSSAPWYALLPEEVLGAGTHRIDAYLASQSEDGLVLHPPSGDAFMPSYLGIPLGRIAYLGVETHGLLEGKPRAASRVEFLVPMRPTERPHSMDVLVEALDPDATEMEISVNGTRVFGGTIGPGAWRRRFGTPELVAGEPVRIEINGDPRQIDPERDWTFGQMEIQLNR